MNSKEAYKVTQLEKELQYWKDKKKYEGSNYVTDQYIERYEDEISKLKHVNKDIEEEYEFDEEEMERGQKERLIATQKKLKRRLKRNGTLNLADQMLLNYLIDEVGNQKI